MIDFDNARQSENFAIVFGKFKHCISSNENIELTPDEVKGFMNFSTQLAGKIFDSEPKEEPFDFPEIIGGDDKQNSSTDEYLVMPPPPSSPFLMSTPIKRVLNVLRADNLDTFQSMFFELQETLRGFDCVTDVEEVKGECVMIYSYFEEMPPVFPTN